jgi:hypothetical protein
MTQISPHREMLELNELLFPSVTRGVPRLRDLDRALRALPPGALWNACETSPDGPLYFLPTREWIAALARRCRRLGPSVLEVAAGNGLVSRALASAAPRLKVRATDSGRWERAAARLSAAERRAWRGVPLAGVRLGNNVERLGAVAAVRRYRPDIVLAIWLPPGPLLARLIRSPCRYVLEVGAPGGVTAQGAWDWRFAHEFCEGPLERLGRCRLDERPARDLHTRVTLYYGGLHPDHAVERPRPGDWLYQFKP